jgi:hypothetical protein
MAVLITFGSVVMRELVLLFCLLILSAVTMQAEVAFPPEGFIAGWTKSEATLRFSPDSLYSYIDGGADLFLEFGFEQLLVQRYVKGDDELDVEVYQMARSEGALGIYLMRCGAETPVAGVDVRNSGNGSQIMMVKGNYYLQIISLNADTALVPAMTTLARQTLATIPAGLPVSGLNWMPDKDIVKGSRRIIAGPLSLQPIIKLGKGNLLRLGGEVFGMAGEYRGGESSTPRYEVTVLYPDQKTAQAAHTNLIANLDPNIKTKPENNGVLSFRDSQGRAGLIQFTETTIILQIDKPESRSTVPIKK